MSYSIGDGMVSLALAGGIVGYFYLTHQTRQKRLEIIHQERMAAMEKGIPLPEFPLEPEKPPKEPDPRVLPILGVVLASLAIGTMIALYMTSPTPSNGFWISPLPFAFLGVGLFLFNFFHGEHRR